MGGSLQIDSQSRVRYTQKYRNKPVSGNQIVCPCGLYTPNSQVWQFECKINVPIFSVPRNMEPYEELTGDTIPGDLTRDGPETTASFVERQDEILVSWNVASAKLKRVWVWIQIRLIYEVINLLILLFIRGFSIILCSQLSFKFAIIFWIC